MIKKEKEMKLQETVWTNEFLIIGQNRAWDKDCPI